MELRLDSKTITSYVTLMKVMKNALMANWPKLTFTSTSPRTSPTESVSTPIITYSLEKKEPAELNKTKELKPRLRETIVVEKLTYNDEIIQYGGALEVWGQMFDYAIAFNVYGANEDEADDTADKFQQFMLTYTGYLKKLGVSELIFLDMKNNPEERTRANLACRTIRYFIRLDEVVGLKTPIIEDILIDYDAAATLERILEFYVPEWKAAADKYIADKNNNE